jgi:hypothetical protein
MNELNRSKDLWHFTARTLALLSVAAALAAGCAANPSRVEQAISADRRDDWAQRIHSLPVEVHGALPGETTTPTIAAIAAIDHGAANLADTEVGKSGPSLYAVPHVVVYIGGAEAPARDQYCTLEPSADRSVATPKNALILRSELCDGPRPVAFARITVPGADPTTRTLAGDIERIKADLVQSLPLPRPVMPVDYSN